MVFVVVMVVVVMVVAVMVLVVVTVLIGVAVLICALSLAKNDSILFVVPNSYNIALGSGVGVAGGSGGG